MVKFVAGPSSVCMQMLVACNNGCASLHKLLFPTQWRTFSGVLPCACVQAAACMRFRVLCGDVLYFGKSVAAERADSLATHVRAYCGQKERRVVGFCRHRAVVRLSARCAHRTTPSLAHRDSVHPPTHLTLHGVTVDSHPAPLPCGVQGA